MKKELLAHWVNEQLKVHTAAGLAKSLGVSAQGVFKWRNQEVKRLSESSLTAIANYRNENVETVCDWLDIPVKTESFLVSKIERLEKRVRALESAAA